MNRFSEPNKEPVRVNWFTRTGSVQIRLMLVTKIRYSSLHWEAEEFVEEIAIATVHRGYGPEGMPEGAAIRYVRSRIDQLLSVALVRSIADRLSFAVALSRRYRPCPDGVHRFLHEAGAGDGLSDFDPFDHDETDYSVYTGRSLE